MLNATHNAIVKMSATARKEFADADYLIAVKLPAAGGNPVVTVYAGAGLEPRRTDLSGMKEIPANNLKAVQLMPQANELLQFIHPDGTVVYCTNRPRWTWLSLPFTGIS